MIETGNPAFAPQTKRGDAHQPFGVQHDGPER